MAQLGGWVLTPLEAGYPHRLHVLEEPPRVLFGLGDLAAARANRSIAVVGTRRPTALGRSLAMRVAARLVESGAVVVSGLATGIDSAAHASALDGGGRTVAVVGGGLDAPGPAINRRLAQAIIARGGAILSEHAPGIGPTRGTFPKRNRLISALATGTIVIEAPARSGALITARHALEQGRILLVAPGRPTDRSVAGCLTFLRETPARPLIGLDEMVVDLGLDGTAHAESAAATGALSAAAALDTLPPHERSVAAALMDGPQTVDAIVDRLAVAPGVVAAALTILQMRGWARVHGSIQLASGPLLDTSSGGR
jgi:DNA processing protein